MSRLLIGFLLVFLYMGCQRDQTPKGIVPQKEMSSLLYDFHMVEGYLSSIPVDSNKLLARNYYASVFKKYHTDSAHFNQSLLYYSKRPGTLNEIYAQVQDRLQKLQTEEQGLVDAKMRKIFVADSIKNAHVQDSLNRIQRDSINLKLTKQLLYSPGQDSLKPRPWSLALHEALVKNIFGLKGSQEELQGALHVKPDSVSTSKPDSVVKKQAANRSNKKR